MTWSKRPIPQDIVEWYEAVLHDGFSHPPDIDDRIDEETAQLDQEQERVFESLCAEAGKDGINIGWRAVNHDGFWNLMIAVIQGPNGEKWELPVPTEAAVDEWRAMFEEAYGLSLIKARKRVETLREQKVSARWPVATKHS